ncbi:MAG: type I 3-dehydroquinate dehydratase, partial [Saezia sp.]
MQTVKVKNVVLGEGAPKIIVSLMGRDIVSVKSQAELYKSVDLDIVEFRADHLDNFQDQEQVKQAVQALKNILTDKPILFTFRTAKEGGEKELAPKDYIALNKAIIDSGLVDMIDLELFTGDELVAATIKHAHEHGVKVIMSNHDFHTTPPKEEIVKRLRKMQELGADVPKIAVMPQSKDDVLTLLSATVEMAEKYANRPIITMSMSKTGVISRLA